MSEPLDPSPEVVTVGSAVYREHPNFEAPADPVCTIWRYIDLARLIDLLARKALLAPASTMSSAASSPSRVRTRSRRIVPARSGPICSAVTL